MPSIYPQIKQKDHRKRPHRLTSTAFICGLSALLAFLVTLLIFLSVKAHKSREVITYVKTNFHPRKLQTLQSEDVFISVKTTHKNHASRLETVISTWYQLAREHTYFFTDKEDANIRSKVKEYRVTGCGDSHSRQDLCCKMAAEFDAFLDSHKKWFCHFDDDNYVNVPSLVDKLNQFDYRQDWYLGKPSLPEPLEILDRDNNKQVKFWFATGGAGFCLSQSLASKMMPLIGGGRFESVGEKIRLPDDVTMGYVIESLLKVPMTVVNEFHSHMEPHKNLPVDHDTISYSYMLKEDNSNVLDIQSNFSNQEDPTR